MTDLEVATNGERIIWRGKPKFSCFILETIFNPMLFFALIWAAIDVSLIRGVMNTGQMGDGDTMGWFLILFFTLHLMPVWICLAGVLTSVIKYKHTEYIITERGIYVSGGVFSVNIEMKPFTDLAHVNLHKGIFDQFLGVGDVIMTCAHTGVTQNVSMNYRSGRNHHQHEGINICDIADYQQVFKIVKDMQTDIYSDTMYPNAIRPDNNPGYGTRYDKY